MRYVALYNHQLPQSALHSKTPIQAMKDWYASHPDLFHKRPYDRPGCDTYINPLIFSGDNGRVLGHGFVAQLESATR